MFHRLVRLGARIFELDEQGRSRPEISSLYRWRYGAPPNFALKDLPAVSEKGSPHGLANAGFACTSQLVDVGPYMSRGEVSVLGGSYQNLAEAEFVVAAFSYMRLLGYPAEKIAILTTHADQASLIDDIVRQRCVPEDFLGSPGAISTTDAFQGCEADYVLLSLVRTEGLEPGRDVEGLLGSLSRARLGMWIFCRTSLFENCFELAPVMHQLQSKPRHLQLVLNEHWPSSRPANGELKGEHKDNLFPVEQGLAQMGALVKQMHDMAKAAYASS